MGDKPASDEQPVVPERPRILWRQWAMSEAVMMRPASDEALFRLANRIFEWVTETRAEPDRKC